MVQFYFLSVFLNLVGGYSLVLVALPRRQGAAEGLRVFLRDRSVSLVIGVLVAVTGALKLLTVFRGDIPVVGDFLPAVAGLAVGVTLLLEHFHEGQGEGASPETTGNEGGAGQGHKPAQPNWMESLLLDHKTAVGIAGIIAAAVHFLFPTVLFL